MTTRPKPLPAPLPRDVDPDAPPTEEEVVASEALRRALDDPRLPHPAADLARAASLAHAPRALDPEDHRRLVDAALARRPPRVRRLARLAFGAGAGLALAAGVALAMGSLSGEATPTATVHAPAPLIRARTTQPLFDEPFAATRASGYGSARIDRIAMARGADFRENEYARWGAR